MKIFKYEKNDEYFLSKCNYHKNYFDYEIPIDNQINMHSFIMQKRENIFDTYLYLLPELQISDESQIDLVGFDEDGAIYMIEIKRCQDQRNRQEVISQLGKYALDTLNLNNIISSENISSMIDNSEINKSPNNIKTLIKNIKNNIEQSRFNLYLVTEDVSDEVLSASYFMSYGPRFRKISIIEIKRIEIENNNYCFLRTFNKQDIDSSTRKPKEDLDKKLKKVKDSTLRNRFKILLDEWKHEGYGIEPNTESTNYLTFKKDTTKTLAYLYVV